MSSRHDDGDDRRAKRVVDETAEHVQSTRNRFYQQHLDDPLAISVAQWWDVLKKHRDDNTEVWENYNLDQIRTLIFRTTTAQRAAPGDTQATQAVEVPMLDAMSRAQLLDLSDRLDDFAKAIGFAPRTKNRRSRYHIQRRDPDEHPEPHNEHVKRPGE